MTEQAEKFDIAIIGGGPGGSSAAREAASNTSLDVVVLERGVEREDRTSLGPDSTDAAGFLDYWLEIADIDEENFYFPDVQKVDKAEFLSPNAKYTLDDTGMNSWYDSFGFTFNRVKMDNILVEKAKNQGVDYRINEVRNVETSTSNSSFKHYIETENGDEITSKFLILADGPQRNITLDVLKQFINPDKVSNLRPKNANHIAYQEYRRFPEKEYDSNAIKFWWGFIPGETAYLWCFPSKNGIAKIGLTAPVGTKIDSKQEYELVKKDENTLPSGSSLINRLLEKLYGDKYDIEQDFPLVKNKGKTNGSEGYLISSTKPIDSPIKANIAVVGGAMGSTSSFHEGGYHLALCTGKTAGRLISKEKLHQYNKTWKKAAGEEIARNLRASKLVGDLSPQEWDSLLTRLTTYQKSKGHKKILSGLGISSLVFRYFLLKIQYNFKNYTQIKEEDYQI